MYQTVTDICHHPTTYCKCSVVCCFPDIYQQWTWCPRFFFSCHIFPLLTACLSIFYSWQDISKHQKPNKKTNKVRATMWVVGTVRVSHCDHNSFSGTAENMGVIHTKSSKACCSFFSLSLFFPPLWPGLAFERYTLICHLHRGFYGAVPCFALQ